jgi:hypothetical protein
VVEDGEAAVGVGHGERAVVDVEPVDVEEAAIS